MQLEAYLVNLYQTGKIKTEVSEEQMKMILETISGPSEKFRIIRK
jgi:DNA-binding TFAR19-related protein (PDSD5 family)